MEITQEQLTELVAKQVEAQLADRHINSKPKELLEFKHELKQLSKDRSSSGVNYASIGSAINTLLRVKFKLKRVDDLPLSQIGEARDFINEIKVIL